LPSGGGHFDGAPGIVADVDVNSAAQLGDTGMNFVLFPLEHRLGGDGLDGHLHSIGTDASPCLFEIQVTQVLPECLTADAMRLAMAVNGNIGKGLAVGGVK
jgi:hypothetical protein